MKNLNRQNNIKATINKSLKGLLFIFVISLFSQVSTAAEFKLAYVDIQEAIKQSKAGKKASEEMKKEADKKTKDLEKKKADIEKMREDIEKKKSVLSEEAFGKKAAELQEEMAKFNQNAQKIQAELGKKETDLLAPIVDKLKKVIEKIAKEKGFSMVIQSNPNTPIVLFSAAEYNLTTDVITAFDKEK